MRVLLWVKALRGVFLQLKKFLASFPMGKNIEVEFSYGRVFLLRLFLGCVCCGSKHSSLNWSGRENLGEKVSDEFSWLGLVPGQKNQRPVWKKRMFLEGRWRPPRFEHRYPVLIIFNLKNKMWNFAYLAQTYDILVVPWNWVIKGLHLWGISVLLSINLFRTTIALFMIRWPNIAVGISSFHVSNVSFYYFRSCTWLLHHLDVTGGVWL